MPKDFIICDKKEVLSKKKKQSLLKLLLIIIYIYDNIVKNLFGEDFFGTAARNFKKHK